MEWSRDQIFRFNLQQDSLPSVNFLVKWRSYPCIILLVYVTMYKMIFLFMSLFLSCHYFYFDAEP